MEIAFNAIVPLFAVIAVGYFVRRRGWLGGDTDLAAGAVVFSTALSFFTLFGWIVLFKSMGVF